ncbi:unnamed protein product, partial [Closterium sp. NIES-54]
VDAVEPVEVAVYSGPERGTEPEGTEPRGAETRSAEPGSAATGGAAPLSAATEGTETGGAAAGGAEPWGAEPRGASTVLRPEPPSPRRLREWYARCCSLRSGASHFELPPAGGPAGAVGGPGAAGGATGAAGGAGATGGAAGAARGATGAAGGATSAAGGAGATRGAAGAAGGATGAAGGAGATGGAAGAAGGTGAAGGAGATGGAAGTAGGTVAAGGDPSAAGVGAAAGGAGAVSAGSGGTSPPQPYFVPLLQQPTSPLPGPSPYTGPTGGLTERREPESRPVSPESRSVSPVRAVRPGRRVSRQRPPAVPGTHHMLLRLSTAPRRVPLPSPPASSLPALVDPESDSLRAASPTVTRLLSPVVTDPSFESAAASALVTELVDFAAHCRLDYAAILEEFECFAATVPHLVSMLIAPEGDPDALDIPTLRSYAEAIAGEYSSQWQTAMDAEMASWKSTGTYVDEVPPPRANIVNGMWIFRVRRPPGSQPVLWHDTLRTTLAALGFSSSTVDPSLFLRTDTSLPPFYILVFVDDLVFATADTEALAHVKSELQKRQTCTDLGELTTYLGLRITRDRARRTITLTQSHMVQQVLQRFGITWSSAQATPLAIGHSLSSLPSDESIEPSGPYPELVGCL